MKDALAVIKEENLSDKKNNWFQRRIAQRYWVGWGGGYGPLKKKS